MQWNQIFLCGILIIFGCNVGHAAEGINFFDFLASATAEKQQNMTFSPDDGKKFRKTFERKYGRRGRHLIDSMGQGASAYLPEITTQPAGKKNGTKVIRKIKKTSTTSTIKPEKNSSK